MKKGLLIGSIIALTVVAAGVAVIGVGSKGFTDWETDNWFSDLKENTGNPDEDPNDGNEEPAQFYSVSGANFSEVVKNLTTEIEPKVIDLSGYDRVDFYSKIVNNYHTIFGYNTHTAKYTDAISITSGNYQYTTRYRSGVTNTYYDVILKIDESKYYDLTDGSEFNETVSEINLSKNSAIKRLLDIDVTLQNYSAFDYLSICDNANTLTIKEYNTGNFTFYFFDTTNVNYYFLPDNLTFELDMTTCTNQESTPTYSDNNFKTIVSSIFKLD